MSDLVKAIKAYTYMDQASLQEVDVHEGLDATLTILGYKLKHTRIAVERDYADDLPRVCVYGSELNQVWTNLLDNAIDALGETGTIRIATAPWEKDGVEITISDDGPGIPEEAQRQVFEPFFTTKAEGEGTGLGLSISQGIVKEHGGRIMLSSEEGKGSTFTVQLPLSTRSVIPPAHAGIRAPTKRLRVLVVDDEPHILHYMRATLEAWGHIPVVASDGEEALARVSRESFDLIISDLRMPRFDGREFYEELARRNPALAGRLVFSTGDTVRGDTLAFLETLDRPYLHKPFSLAELRALLADVVRESGPHLSVRDPGAIPADILPGA
jgi:CheY-like chemotaxis protein